MFIAPVPSPKTKSSETGLLSDGLEKLPVVLTLIKYPSASVPPEASVQVSVISLADGFPAVNDET